MINSSQNVSSSRAIGCHSAIWQISSSPQNNVVHDTRFNNGPPILREYAPQLGSIAKLSSDMNVPKPQEKVGMEALCKMTPSELAKQNIALTIKLYAVLCNSEFENVIAWMPHGRAWKILNLEGFVEQVLPLFLNYASTKSQHFNTFVRLLKIWGFRQFTKGPDTSAFYNEMFVRGKPSLVLSMRPSDVNGRNTLHDPSSEPNFYAISPVVNTTSQVSPSILDSFFLASPSSSVALTVSPCSNKTDRQGWKPLLRPKDAEIASFLLLDKNSQKNKVGHSSRGFQANTNPLSVLPARLGGDRRYIHESTVEYLQRARFVADTIPFGVESLLHSASVNSQTPCATPEMTRMSTLVTDNHESGESNPKAAIITPAKKSRRKWLPPLGPATSDKFLLHKKQRNSPPIVVPSSPTLTNANAVLNDLNERATCEWIYDNPEVFASLSCRSSKL